MTSYHNSLKGECLLSKFKEKLHASKKFFIYKLMSKTAFHQATSEETGVIAQWQSSHSARNRPWVPFLAPEKEKRNETQRPLFYLYENTTIAITLCLSERPL